MIKIPKLIDHSSCELLQEISFNYNLNIIVTFIAYLYYSKVKKYFLSNAKYIFFKEK